MAKKIVLNVVILFIGVLIGRGISPICDDLSHTELEDMVTQLEETLEEKNSQIEKLGSIDEAVLNMSIEEINELEEKVNKIESAELEEQLKIESMKKPEAGTSKKDYDTKIVYKDLVEKPKNYIGEKVKFKGRVLQVIENENGINLRLAVKGNYSNVIYCSYDKSIYTGTILEDDYITVMGVSNDLITYNTVSNEEVTIPFMYIHQIEK